MPANFPWREFAKHVFSWRLLLFFAVLKALMFWVEKNPLVERATLPGVDIAMMRVSGDTARRTVVVGITPEDVAARFDNTRPIPPDSLMRAVASLARLKPAALVVDVFTEDRAYAGYSFRIANVPIPIVWAQSADTGTGALLPVLGDSVSWRTSGIAAMLAEEDGLVRRVRLSFRRSTADSGRPTLAFAAVEACRKHEQSTGMDGGVCRLEAALPSDTSSVALRSYIRDPIFYTLGDVLAAASADDTTTFASQILVLGFVDGSDQVATPFGIRTGPSTVADAIETLLDDDGLIRRPPHYLGIGLDLFAAFLVAALQFLLRNKPNAVAALATLGLTVVAYFGARFIMLAFNYWTSFLPVMVGVWGEQLVEQIREGTKRQRDNNSLGATPAPSPTLPMASPAHSAASPIETPAREPAAVGAPANSADPAKPSAS
jgi:CHASE2 domain-containing sensor protein